MSDAAIVRAWYKGAAWLWLLRPLEWLYRGVVAIRRWCYERGVISRYRAPVPVVVIGNVTVGGTGKTPVVIAIAQALRQTGRSVGVVSRGYGGRSERYPLVVEATTAAIECGDEPLLIRQTVDCPVVVDPDRPAAVRRLLSDFSVDVVISDDGLQHYALARDFELVLVDGQRGLGNGWCLPAGPLREPSQRLESADAVIYRDGVDSDSAFFYAHEGLFRLSDGAHTALNPKTLGADVYAIAGIGQPEQFFSTLEQAGFSLQRKVFPDHHQYTVADFGAMADLPIIMTAKDAVKCAPFAGADAWQLPINAVLPSAVIDAIVERLPDVNSGTARPET